ncbi:tandem-95 repeat, partial [Paramuricea clavata]
VGIAFQNVAQDVPETQSSVLIPIVLTGNRAVPITFAIDTVSVSATQGTDYVWSRQSVTINPNDPSTYIASIPITNDNIVEGDELFRVLIDASNALVTNNGAFLTVTIKDDDTANVRFSQSTYVFGENVNVGTVTIEIDRNLETTATVTVSSTTNTATSGVDFVAIVSRQVIFTSGDTSKQLTVRILDDNIVEANEVLSLSLTTGTGSPLAVGTPGTALITINDDDVASVEMDSISYTYSENDATAVVEAKLNALAPIARPLSFRIFTENGTAYSPRDFTHLDQIGVFNPGVGNDAKVSFSIVISNDVVVENTESFFVQLAEINSALQIVNPNRSTVFIQDNDAFEAQFTHGDLTVNEEAGSVQISVRLNGQHEREVTIRLTTTQITATAGADYENQVVDLQFSPGDSLEALDIRILDDLVIEGTETFRVTISSNDAQVRIVDPPSITVTIIDTDVATVSFNQTEYRVSEDVGSSALWVELKNDLQLNAEVNVQVYNFPDTAKSPEDYTFANTLTILTFRGGQTKLLPIYYNVIDDNNVENEESFYGLINADGVTVRAEEPLLVKAYIEDNDVAIVGFTQALYTVNENADAVVEVQLQNTLAVSVTVSIKTTTGTAGSNDFGGITRRDLTFDPGETTIPVTIQIVRDVNVENNENFIVSLETTHPRVQFSRNTATVRIDDDDRVSIAFQQPRYIVNEDDGSVQISYPIVGSTDVPLNYVVHIDQGSARLGSDYLGIALPVTISQGTTQNTVTVQLVNDENIESNETFALRMDNLNDARIILANPSTTTVEILDDDAATVEFTQPQYSVLESGVSVTATLNLTGILDQATTVSVSSHDVTAIAGLDYTAISNQEITFTPNGPTEQDIVVQISNDSLLEGTESFLLAVSSQNVNTRIGDNANTTVRILDNDVVSVDFVLTSVNALEQVSAAIVEIEIQGARTLPVTVRVQSINLNAESGSDYTAVDTEVTFQTSESTKSVPVLITNDNLIEIDEQFILRLSSDDNNVIINDNEMRITIVDNDVAAIRFEQSSYTVNEANDNVTLHILLTGNLGIPVSAEVQLNAQTADDGTDFTIPITRTVTFSPGSNRADITINIIDDDIVEATETFFADLAGIGPKVILGSPRRTTVFIQDNDNALVRFLISTRNVNEDAGFLNMTIELITVNPLQRDVSVRYSTEEGTAESPEDFSNVVGSTVIFRAGDSNGARQYGIVPIIDDQIVEASESFIIRLISIDPGLIPTTFSSTTISIIDNDRATLAFAQSAYSVNEPDTPVQLLVLLTGTITRTVTARVNTLNIDAVGGSDYSSIADRQITFSPGNPTFQSVDVTINDDAIVENNERFTATLTAENGVNIRPDRATTTVTIVDNDVVTVSLQASQIDVTEASANAIVLVTVNGAREREISVK